MISDGKLKKAFMDWLENCDCPCDNCVALAEILEEVIP